MSINSNDGKSLSIRSILQSFGIAFRSAETAMAALEYARSSRHSAGRPRSSLTMSASGISARKDRKSVV